MPKRNPFRKSRKTKRKQRAGSVLGYGRYGCVVKPAPICGTRKAQVGKWIARTIQRSPDRNMRTLYPLLDSPDFQQYQAEFPTEYEKAQEIRARIGLHADTLFVLPQFACSATDLYMNNSAKANYEACQSYIPEQLTEMIGMWEAQGDLAHILSQPKSSMDAKAVLYQFETVLEGLKALHEHRVLHFDIRSENILQTTHGLVLADFGISLLFPLSGTSTARSRSSSSSSSSLPLFSPVPQTKSALKPLAIPALRLGHVSPRPNMNYNSLLTTGFEAMKRVDMDAVWDVVLRLFHWANLHTDPRVQAFLNQRRTPMGATDIHREYKNLLSQIE